MAQVAIYIGAYYSISKAALDHYTRVAAIRLAPSGVRINTVWLVFTQCRFKISNLNFSAGHIDTPFLGPNRTTAPLDFLAAYKQDLNDRTAMKRAASPQEINSLVEFLCSQKASYITGSIVVADGGFLAGVLPPDPKKN